jgi:hypothetical protein
MIDQEVLDELNQLRQDKVDLTVRLQNARFENDYLVSVIEAGGDDSEKQVVSAQKRAIDHLAYEAKNFERRYNDCVQRSTRTVQGDQNVAPVGLNHNLGGGNTGEALSGVSGVANKVPQRLRAEAARSWLFFPETGVYRYYAFSRNYHLFGYDPRVDRAKEGRESGKKGGVS